MYKVPVVIQPEYIIFFEPSKNAVLVHCDIRVPWTKETKKKLQESWRILRELHGHCKMFARHEPHQGMKHRKFLFLMGFDYQFKMDNDVEVWSIGGQNGL